MHKKTSRGRVRTLAALALALVLTTQAAPAFAQACSAPSFTQPPVYRVGSDTRYIASADFDGDGRPDLAVTDVNSDSVTVIEKVAQAVPAKFNTYTVGRFPLGVVAADFNSDGKPDIVVANSSSANVSLLLNDGTGGFFSGGAFAVPDSPRFIAVGDFNGDGKLDLAITGTSSRFVSVLLGDGAGGFGGASTFPVGAQTLELIAADFSGDGKLDLAVGTVGFVRTLIGDGAGHFAAAQQCSQSVGDLGLASADLNGDGKADLVNANSSGATIEVAFGDGTGCFAPPASANVLNLGRPDHVTLGDLNGDGKLDIIAGATVMLNNGSGVFGAPRLYASVGSNAVARDFDGDGKLDIAATSSGFVNVLLGDGAGGFRNTIPDNGAFGVARGDFDGDGKLDLALATGGVSIALGDGAGGFGRPVKFGASANAFSGPVVADFNRDGKLDAAIGGSRKAFVLLGDGAGNLGEPIVTDTSIFEVSGIAGGADFNGDGNPDIGLLDRAGGSNNGGSFHVLLGDGTGHFLAPKVVGINTPANPKQVALADFNGDGKIDVGMPSGFGFSTALGDGAGGFTNVTLNTTANASSAVPADFNGDGKVDLALLSEEQNGKLSVVLGDGAGGFGAPKQFTPGGFTQDLTVADFNGDNHPDIAVTSARTVPDPLPNLPALSVYFGDGAGDFAPAVNFTTSLGRVVSGDFNGDGRVDVVAVAGNFISVHLNTCAGASGGSPTFQFDAPLYTVDEGAGSVTVTVTRTGSANGAASVRYATSDGVASSRSDYIPAFGTLRFADGETSKSFVVLIVDDRRAGEADESLNVTLSNPVGAALGAPSSAVVSIHENDPTITSVNPIDDSTFFVRQHYLDFLNREPDASGLAFWVNEIEKCGADSACRDVRRINVSAAFFRSIEFQETGYLVERTYKVAFGDTTSPGVDVAVPIVRLDEFLSDTQQIGQGFIVGQGDWQTKIEANKVAYFADFVSRQRFVNAAPTSMTPAQFVDALFQHAGVTPTAEQRQAAIDEFGGAADTADAAARARALRRVAENPTLNELEKNRAFVLMEYFGYLRRNPDDVPQPGLNYSGWKFWLDKLNQFNGDFVKAEMVKAFISSDEYRARFNSPSGF